MDMDTRATGDGKRGRPPADVAADSQGPTCVLDKRCKRDALRAAFFAGKEVVEDHAQLWTSEFKPQVEDSRPSAVEGVEAAISVWVAGESRFGPGIVGRGGKGACGSRKGRKVLNL